MKPEHKKVLKNTAEAIVGLCTLTLLCGLLFSPLHPPWTGEAAAKGHCKWNLKQIAVAFRIWSEDNGGQYPFNVSTNQGGTREYRQLRSDGFDGGGAFHLRAMSNELGTQKVLICRSDQLKEPAIDFQHLEPDNITYQIHSGINVNTNHPGQILAVCPIHGHTLTLDGTVHLKGKL